LITESRLKIDRGRAANTAMEAIMRINGGLVMSELGSKESMQMSVKLLQGVKEDVSNMLDIKIREIQKMAERKA